MAQEKTQLMKTVIRECLLGDVRAAFAILRDAPTKTDHEVRFMERMQRRFFISTPAYRVNSPDPWVRGVIRAYQKYYRDALATDVGHPEAEARLMKRLTKYVQGTDLDEVEKALEKEFGLRDLYFLGGKTPPFWGPYVWQTQERHVYHVELPTGTQDVTVHFLKDFIALSWLDYATLGMSSTGGWATDDALYLVYHRYHKDFGKPEFEISYLKHEAQHLHDLRKCPGLPSRDLEYRAKLVELIYYPTLDKFLEFQSQASPAPDNPHAYAAHMIVSRISAMLPGTAGRTGPSEGVSGSLSVASVQSAALQLFKESTSLLNRGQEVYI